MSLSFQIMNPISSKIIGHHSLKILNKDLNQLITLYLIQQRRKLQRRKITSNKILHKSTSKQIQIFLKLINLIHQNTKIVHQDYITKIQ